MGKYHFNISINKTYHNAGTKAVADAKAILIKNGYEDIEISFIKTLYLMPFNLLKLSFRLLEHLIKIKSGSLIIIQYPLLGVNRFFSKYIKLLKSKKCKIGCIIHDLDSIRSEDNALKITLEIAALNAYDVVIAHNAAMSAWLKSNGFLGEIILLELFDYLSSERAIDHKIDMADIVFAGNLGRCVFLNEIEKIKAPAINLYGPGLDNEIIKDSENIRWLGSFSPEQIVNEISGKFGLVWDGTSITESTGLMGHYLKYNSPHKVSLYLTCGIPVIVPATSAIAPIILKEGLGFAIDSLMELDHRISSLNENEYLAMKTKAQEMGALLKTGHHLSLALNKFEYLCRPK